MDKPLSDKEITASGRGAGDEKATQPARGGAVPGMFGDAGIGAYTKGSPYLAGTTQKDWDSDRKAWNDSKSGRLAIRVFSRGVMGAAFFAAGGMLTKKWMNPDNGLHYDPTKTLTQQENPLQFIAKLIDTVVGKPIEWTVTQVAGKEMGLRSVNFRPLNKTFTKGIGGAPGRSLGHESVGVTFDFFCASVGDAWGRDIAGWVDPNIRKSKDPNVRQKWIGEDGQFKPTEAVKQSLKSLWQYVSYNGGEDWAVAIPYAYFMKAQRAGINKISPGFATDFDHVKNGSAFKVRDEKAKETFAVEGAIDLQGRFTVYNMGTLMYRELYDYADNKIHGKRTRLYGSPEDTHKQNQGLLANIGDVAKWFVRSVIKGGIYMTPVVPTFWVTRVTQFRGKDRDAFITPGGTFAERSEINNLKDLKLYGESETPQGKFFDAVGGLNAEAVSLVQAGTRKMDRFSGGRLEKQIGKVLGGSSSDFAKRYTNAAVAYTPYMYSKAEAAKIWDTGKMDMSLERMIDGAAHLNWGEFKAGAGEVLSSVKLEVLADPVREAEGRRRNELDTSLPADVNLDEKLKRRKMAAKNDSGWRQRLIQGNPESKGYSADKTVVPNASFADQEELRKALRDLTPPTNSYH